MSDPGISYRSREEVMEVRKTRDPILLIQQYLKKYEVYDEKEIKVPPFIQEIEREVKEEVDQAIKQAQADPLPDIHTLTEDVYIDSSSHYIRGADIKDSKLPN